MEGKQYEWRGELWPEDRVEWFRLFAQRRHLSLHRHMGVIKAARRNFWRNKADPELGA